MNELQKLQNDIQELKISIEEAIKHIETRYGVKRVEVSTIYNSASVTWAKHEVPLPVKVKVEVVV